MVLSLSRSVEREQNMGNTFLPEGSQTQSPMGDFLLPLWREIFTINPYKI